MGGEFMKFKPLADRILGKIEEQEQKTESGIIIPDTAKEKPQKARVEAVGGDVEHVKVGDLVLFAKYSGTELKLNDQDYIILKEDEVLGIFE
jgi:chaperonin GroES